ERGEPDLPAGSRPRHDGGGPQTPGPAGFPDIDPRMRSRLVVAMALGATLFLSATTAVAEDAAKAATLAEAAAIRAKAGERRVAIDLFEEAYAAAPRREYLRQIAELYAALALGADPRDIRLALLSYERYLREEGQTPERAMIEARVARLREWKVK